MRRLPLSFGFTLLLPLLLAACAAPSTPAIGFIGIAKGDLRSDVSTLAFADRFSASDHSLVGVVALKEPVSAGRAVATWFSPDDRTMPLGRTTVELGSGATVARFSFANKENWKPAPYMLDVRLEVPARKSRPESPVYRETSSGSMHFFIGLTDRQVQTYVDDYIEWQRREEEQRRFAAAGTAREQNILAAAKLFLRAPSAVLALRQDLTGDDRDEFVVADTGGLPPLTPPSPPLLLSNPVQGFAILDGSGTALISLGPQKGGRVLSLLGTAVTTIPPGPVHLTLLPSSTVSLAWNAANSTCTLEFSPSGHTWTAGEERCRAVK